MARKRTHEMSKQKGRIKKADCKKTVREREEKKEESGYFEEEDEKRDKGTNGPRGRQASCACLANTEKRWRERSELVLFGVDTRCAEKRENKERTHAKKVRKIGGTKRGRSDDF